MKTIAQIKFDSIIKHGFHEILKPLGFKKKANNFYVQLEDVGQIINIQKSQWGSKDSISFTINTGIFVPEYWLGLLYNKDKKLPKYPTEPECLIRKRIGEIRNQHDTWYDIEDHTDENKLIIEMKHNVENFILPYFHQINNRKKLLNALKSKELIIAPLGKLIVYGELKLFDSAQKEYQKLLNEKTSSNFLEIVQEYGRKYKLT